MKIIRLFIFACIIGFLVCGKARSNANAFLILEAKTYNDTIGQIGVEEKSNASNNKWVHSGSDSDVEGTVLDDFDALKSPNNLFIAERGTWCCSSENDCHVCNEDNLIVSYDKGIHLGTQGASLKLSYNVEQENSLASYCEYLKNGNTYYDLTDFDEFSFWVKEEGNTIGSDTKFYIRFSDKEWNMEYVEIKGISGDGWQKKTIDLTNLTNMDLKQMNELTIIFRNDEEGAYPLSGTLYFDNLSFIDHDIDVGSDDKFLDLLERRAFKYFWEYADSKTGLIRDRASDPDVCSIAAVGFGLTSLCIAKKRGWISHDDAYSRVLTTLNSFYDDPDDPNDFCVEGTHGLFWHFVNINDGTPLYWDGVSTIDSALLMAGVLTCRQYFAGTEIETLATKIYEAAEWDWFLNNDGLLYMKWTPTEGLSGCWGGYNEAMILYLLAIGSPTHSIPASSWDAWASFYKEHWGAYYGYPVLTCPALFTHQYSHCWVDFRDKKDAYVNYFKNSVFATLANRAYSKDIWYPDANIDLWGITACDGPVPGTCVGRVYRAGLGYPPDSGNNDGTVAPTAVGASIVFTPEYSLSTLRYMFDYSHQKLWGLYGLKDSMNSICDPEWYANEYIGIDVGAMVIMIENYRSGFIWDIFMQNKEITAAMEKVGFKPDNAPIPECFYYHEAEDYEAISGNGINIEDHSSAWSGKTVQIGEDPDNSVTYNIDLQCEGTTNLFFEIRYSDDVAGNKIDVYIDEVKKGSFITDKFGGWEDFSWDDERISVGSLPPGAHTVKLKIATDGGGSWGANLDAFRLIAYPDIVPSESVYNFGTVKVGHSKTHTFTVSNIGDIDRDISKIHLSKTRHFSIINDECSNKSIAPGESCIVVIKFSPKSEGKKRATLTIQSTDPDSSTDISLTDISLRGRGCYWCGCFIENL
ncbi:MAG: glucoamylase family protein [bacterium]